MLVRIKNSFAAVRRRPWRTLAIALVVGFVGLNGLAYLHARAMLNFTAATERTPSPGSLSVMRKVQVLVSGVSVPRPENAGTPEDIGLPSETVSFGAADDVRIEGWWIAPPEPRGTVILFHGYGASRSSLLTEAKALYDLGYTAVPIDFRGGGGSDGNSTTLGYYEAQDVAAAVRYVRERDATRPLILYGQSMGGAAVLRSIAALDVQPDGIILDSTFDRMLNTVRNRFGMMGVPSRPAAELLVFWGGVQAGFSGFAHDPETYAESCNVPALLQYGALDRNATEADGRRIFDRLRGPKEFVTYDKVGHVSLVNADGAKWKTSVAKFLETLPQPTR